MIYDRFTAAYTYQKKCLALLIDPDNINEGDLLNLKSWIDQCHIDFIFVGGSLIKKDNLDHCLEFLKEKIGIPAVLFPGDLNQINSKADGILFLSLISGRNPELLIGKHVAAAPYLRQSNLEVIPTGYILVDGGNYTSVSYMSQTMPIPNDKPDIAACTASAGELLGLRVIFMDAGSGAEKSVSPAMIRQVRKDIGIPLIVGGGIKTGEQAVEVCRAGADILVIGNVVEKHPERLLEIAAAVNTFNEVNEFT